MNSFKTSEIAQGEINFNIKDCVCRPLMRKHVFNFFLCFVAYPNVHPVGGAREGIIPGNMDHAILHGRPFGLSLLRFVYKENEDSPPKVNKLVNKPVTNNTILGMVPRLRG